MIVPTNHFLVIAPSVVTLFAAGAYVGFACSEQVQKIYEWAECKISSAGTYYANGKNTTSKEDMIVKKVDCHKVESILVCGLVATTLCLGVGFLGATLMGAAEVPTLIQTAFVIGTIIAPVIRGIILIIAKNCGSYRTVVIQLSPDEAKKVTNYKKSGQEPGYYYQYNRFPFPWLNQPERRLNGGI